jgi:hypothetical protein
MTTVRPVPTVGAVPLEIAPADAEGEGSVDGGSVDGHSVDGHWVERHRRRRHRRLLREKLLTVAVLLLALAATLVVLGLQWLDSGQPGNSSAASIAIHNTLGGHT